ncbi:hypothetical protein TREES_T100011948 [Tupaia chinensis]|uniref:Mitochondrial assembly of ribosomal large subunit protein 1 n=1 Tax=Tupaia chinensis TaxID=246437 RepID=L9KQF3_TUPCH|nr:hypothetical protein TREES_T100011948 [Tupaia chinensis]
MGVALAGGGAASCGTRAGPVLSDSRLCALPAQLALAGGTPGGDSRRGTPRVGCSRSYCSTFNIDMLVSLLRHENARDICVIKVPPEMKYTDYFVIGSGTSTQHSHAMAHYIVKRYKYLKCKREPHVQIEGKDTDDWFCVDLGNMVIHWMLPESRETYQLEKLWTLRSYDDQLTQHLKRYQKTSFLE